MKLLITYIFYQYHENQAQEEWHSLYKTRNLSISNYIPFPQQVV